MFSDTRQLGQQRAIRWNSSAGHRFHHTAPLQGERVYVEPAGQTDADTPQQNGGRSTALTQLEEVEGILGWKWTRTACKGQELERQFSLSEERQCAHLRLSSQSSLKELNWTVFPEQGLRYSMSVKECFSQCECVRGQNSSAPKSFRRKFVLPPAELFVGQGLCRKPTYVGEKAFWGDAGPEYGRRGCNAHPECATASHLHRCQGSNFSFSHGQKCTENRRSLSSLTGTQTHSEPLHNGPKSCQAVICSTRVCQKRICYTCFSGNDTKHVEGRAPGEGQVQRGEHHRRDLMRGHASVREQIRRVVSDLERVLGGLKQVHLEMKEVVQQIELLTSNIDLSEEEPNNCLPSNTVCTVSSCRVTASSQKKVINLDLKVDPVPPKNTFQSTPPANNHSAIINQVVQLLPSKAFPEHMSGVSSEEDPEQIGPHRDKQQELQCQRDGFVTASQSHNEEDTFTNPRTVSGNQRPLLCPHYRKVEGGSEGGDSLGETPHPVKQRLLSTTV